jgi:MYXO-CTERM domain-containing protein
MRVWVSCAGVALLAASASAAGILHETFDSGSTPGVIGNARIFADGLAYTSPQPALLKAAPGATISAWVKADPFDTTSHFGSIGFVSGGTDLHLPRAQLRLYYDIPRSQYVLMAQGSKHDDVSVSESDGMLYFDVLSQGDQLSDWAGQWRHVAATFDYAGRTMALFVDGQSVLTDSITNIEMWDSSPTADDTNSTVVSIGTGHTGGEYALLPFQGALDDVVIDSSAWSAARIKATRALALADVNYNAAQTGQLMAGYELQQPVTIGPDHWHYSGNLAPSTPGTVLISAGHTTYWVTSTTGMTTTPEPHAFALLGLGALALGRRRRAAEAIQVGLKALPIS